MRATVHGRVERCSARAICRSVDEPFFTGRRSTGARRVHGKVGVSPTRNTRRSWVPTQFRPSLRGATALRRWLTWCSSSSSWRAGAEAEGTAVSCRRRDQRRLGNHSRRFDDVVDPPGIRGRPSVGCAPPGCLALVHRRITARRRRIATGRSRCCAGRAAFLRDCVPSAAGEQRRSGMILPQSAGIAERYAFVSGLGVAICGLVLLEQLYRRTPQESRWGIKPYCLGLAVGFAFDVAMYADAMLFSRMAMDLWVARGFVYALGSSAYRRGDGAQQGVDRRRRGLARGHHVFHSDTRVRNLPVDRGWCRILPALRGRHLGALQASFVAAAALAFLVLALSGSARARMRVLVSKHFFSYRFDYREEWMRFTRTLSSGRGEFLCTFSASRHSAISWKARPAGFGRGAESNSHQSVAGMSPSRPTASQFRRRFRRFSDAPDGSSTSRNAATGPIATTGSRCLPALLGQPKDG